MCPAKRPRAGSSRMRTTHASWVILGKSPVPSKPSGSRTISEWATAACEVRSGHASVTKHDPAIPLPLKDPGGVGSSRV